MNSVLLSIQPKQCENIINNIKTMEVKKSMPKINTPFKCYIYCTTKGLLTKSHRTGKIYQTLNAYKNALEEKGNITYSGKIIGEFTCDYLLQHYHEIVSVDKAEQESGLTYEQLLEYANGKELFGWHISDLVIYDEPKELGTLIKKPILCHRGTQKDNCDGCWDCQLTSPPRSWCYAEEMEY